MQIGGWKTVSMVMRYAHVNSENTAPSIMKIWDNPGDLDLGKLQHLEIVRK